ncbi:hypothetical protein CEF21_00925 [Bacillus sp. FJAT-42376]|nr:hypothetical protein CEF21_00925 [Bacillus sp. FJAT-42376]
MCSWTLQHFPVDEAGQNKYIPIFSNLQNRLQRRKRKDVPSARINSPFIPLDVKEFSVFKEQNFFFITY